uniref:NTF2 domain-containing protein n=1 Tax=Ananas comosus var. bracteatus TaxID=296719 RepID=A0A6V7P1P1_ANACO|nr:unnamed protein product [Ananas comosus var. bracteatus]
MDERASDRSIDPDVMAREFVEHYCMTFNRNRAALGELYQEGSMLTFEGDKIQGAQAIVAKLASLPFQLHDIYNVDCCQDSDPRVAPVWLAPLGLRRHPARRRKPPEQEHVQPDVHFDADTSGELPGAEPHIPSVPFDCCLKCQSVLKIAFPLLDLL